MGNDRHYNYACILYFDSVKPDFETIISNWHVPAFLSPSHDKDVDELGNPKKAHWHLMLMFENGQHEEHVREKTVSIGGVGLEIVKSKGAYARYLCHLDNPEKHQYDTNDVKEFGGACYADMIKKGVSKTAIYAEIIKYIDETRTRSYAQLLRYAMHFKPTWFEVLCKNGIVIKDYLRSNNFDEDKNTNFKG